MVVIGYFAAFYLGCLVGWFWWALLDEMFWRRQKRAYELSQRPKATKVNLLPPQTSRALYRDNDTDEWKEL